MVAWTEFKSAFRAFFIRPDKIKFASCAKNSNIGLSRDPFENW